jgi:type I restriction enzyme M protein
LLTEPKLRSQVDQLWDKFWSGGLTNPMDAIEQFSYLLFLKRLEDSENARQRQANRRGLVYTPRIPNEMRWSYWSNLEAQSALKQLKEIIFPWFRTLGEEGSSFERYMQNAECKINKASLLIEACKLIDQMEISQQNQDVQGDLYEYLLSKLNTAGRNGQFRTPRHIIRMMVHMVDSKPGERIGDLAAGTAGFLVNAYQHILETHTSPDVLEYDTEGLPHHLVGDQLSEAERQFLKSDKFLRGYDNDSGMTMLRIGSMNMILHGIEAPRFFYMDTLSKAFTDEREYDVILMNPPFKGAIDKGDVSPTLPGTTTKTELLFVHLILRALDMGGRCAVIVPDGVLFGSSRAHIELRKKIIEDNRLDGVVSMPSGVFKPYAGVSTAVLLFTRGARTEDIWFYDMENDGFSLDDKRTPVSENDIPDVLLCWKNRKDHAFREKREHRLEQLKEQVTPLKSERLRLQGEMNRLTFEAAIAPEGASANVEQELARAKDQQIEMEERITPLQQEIDKLSRQFWVSKEKIKENKYDLSASRYRKIIADESYCEKPELTLKRLLSLEKIMENEIVELGRLL